MKYIQPIVRFSFAFGLWLLLTCAGLSQNAAPTETLCVMSYNLRFASSNPPNAWPVRRPLMSEVILKFSPDVIGTQEGLFQQLKDLAADLPGYAWLGIGRDDGREQGEFMAVFYRTNRLQPLSTNFYWLSDTPEIPGSSTWGNKNRRMVTTVKFRDLNRKTEFYFLNTHFDHEIQLAREKSAELVRQRVQQLPGSLPILLVGDFNAAAGTNKAYLRLTQEDFFKDTWPLARERRNEGIATFNGFQGIRKNGPRIDWILLRGKATVDAAEIVTFSRDNQFPSDHFPIIAWVKV
jgi:endonuclease/exonuclease/phosphatase family metal-dependent hydrolase